MYRTLSGLALAMALMVLFAAAASGQGPVYLPLVAGGAAAQSNDPVLVPTPQANSPAPRTLDDTYGRWLLRAWPERVARLEMQETTPAVIAMIGDSWTSRDIISGPLRTQLQHAYGDAGIGYISFAAARNAVRLPGVSVRREGTWTEHINKPDAGGLDLASATGMSGQYEVVFSGTRLMVHYLNQPRAGRFAVSVDGATPTVISTAQPTRAYKTLPLGPFPDGKHTLRIKVVTAAVAGVTLYGIDIQRNVAGVRLHRLGAGGAASSDYAAVPASLGGGLRALTPDLVMIMLGTNDRVRDMKLQEYTDHLRVIVRNARAEVPDADIVLLSPSDNGLDKRYAMSEYAAVMRLLAETEQVTYLDLTASVGPYPRANRRGLYSDPIHPSALGGRIIANTIAARIFH